MTGTGCEAYPLTYCTNVLPGESLEEARLGLERTAVPLRDAWRARGGVGKFPLGLWWSQGVVSTLHEPGVLAEFKAWLEQREFSIATLNCFPYGGFHRRRVKRDVFRPGWHEDARLDYTLRAAERVAQLVPEGSRVPISTLSGTHKAWHTEAVVEGVALGLARCAMGLERLSLETGRNLVLAVEPEPYSTLEDTHEVVEFFQDFLFSGVGAEELRKDGYDVEVLRRRVGICYDTCHQAVEFEVPAEALGRLRAAGVAVHKVQLSSAPVLVDPAGNRDGFEALRAFAEPRYLHQTFGRSREGRLERWEDLEHFLEDSAEQLQDFEEIRTHFHVPIDRSSLGSLGTTQGEMRAALDEVVRLHPQQTLEVETYTSAIWPVARGAGAESELVPSLDAELCAAERFLAQSLKKAGFSEKGGG